jgi:FkbM family methyltransferase
MADRTNRLGMWLVSLPWRINRPRDHVERFGTRVGGWTLPVGRLATGGVCYCAGVGEDTSLEEELLRQTRCRLWSFDPTQESAAHVASRQFDPARFQFVQTGIGDKTERLRFFQHPDPQMLPAYSAVNIWKTSSYIEAPSTTVAALMDRFGHTRLTLLKLSIEGAEWKVLRHLLDTETRPVDVLCVLFSQPAPFWRIGSAVRDLRRHGFRYLCHDQWKFTFVR